MKLRLWTLLAKLSFAGTALLPAYGYCAPSEPDPRAVYELAVKLYSEGQYDQALAEMTKFYEQTRSYKVLYNIGQIKAAMGDLLGAIAAHRRYLDEASDALSKERRQDVAREIEELDRRTAKLSVHVDVTKANVFIDEEHVGVAPVVVPVNPGTHLVRVEHPGHAVQQRSVTLEPGAQQRVLLWVTPAANALSERSDPERQRGPSQDAGKAPLSTPASARLAHPHVSDKSRTVAWWVAAGLGVAAVPTGIAALSTQSNATQSRIYAAACDVSWISAGALVAWLLLDPEAFRSRAALQRTSPASLPLRLQAQAEFPYHVAPIDIAFSLEF